MVIQGNFIDITEAKEARQKLDDMQTLESSILSSIPHVILGLEERDILFVNDEAEVVFGWKPEELIGRTTRILYRNDEEFEEVGNRVYPALEKQPTYKTELEFPCVRKDGREIFCRVTASRIGERLIKKKVVVTYEDITEKKKADQQLRESLLQIQKTMEGIVQSLGAVVERRDPYTSGHQQRVSQLACAIAVEMNLSQEQIDRIRIAALVHDIGKIHVPAEILSKPGLLGDIEFAIIKTHPQAGCDILKTIEFPWSVADIVLQHHERLNGSGYPLGIQGKDILLETKILSVADVVEAMASHRPYRPSRGIQKALEEIDKNREILYDPVVVDFCLKLFREKAFEFEQTGICF
jgi:PAS domain S-box-containing protein/putative nucleotidyltransferase with HDIG domain